MYSLYRVTFGAYLLSLVPLESLALRGSGLAAPGNNFPIDSGWKRQRFPKQKAFN